MKKSSLVILATLLSLILSNGSSGASTAPAREGQLSLWSWNVQKDEVPFSRSRASLTGSVAGPLVYPGKDFVFPLLQVLSFEPKCDCYSLIIGQPSGRGWEVVTFWPTPQGFYRSGGAGPYLELEKLDSLTAVTALNGTRFLFAEVGDSQWRCVSIHDPLGNSLLIDYRADGLIARMRDSMSRTATPAYCAGELVSLTQSWNTRTGQQVELTEIR
jgi:hypothetical protein